MSGRFICQIMFGSCLTLGGVLAYGQELVFGGYTMGTTYQVRVAQGKNTLPDQKRLQKDTEAVLKTVNQQMSTYIKDSELSRFNTSQSTDSWFPVSLATAQVVERALQISGETGGAFDVTLGPLVNLWGFGPEARPVKIPDQEQISKTLSRTGFGKLSVRAESPALKKLIPELYVDLSGIAKGYGVDAVTALLEKEGGENYMVEIGGEIRVRGQKSKGQPWKIAIEKPEEGDQRSVLRVLNLSGGAIATSGDYRNYYESHGERFSHIIDPRDGRPLRHHMVSVTVLALTAMDADAWATALFVAGPEKTKELALKKNMQVFLIQKESGKLSEWASPEFLKLHPGIRGAGI